MTHSWDPVVLPPAYAYGFSGGPAHETQIVRMDGGGEQRSQQQSEERWHWTAMRKNFKAADGTPQNVDQLVKFKRSRKGALYGFLFIDPRRYSTAVDGVSAPTATDQLIGFGNGVKTRFKLIVQDLATGDMSGRTVPRRVVPLHGFTNAAFATLVGQPVGTVFNCSAAEDGATNGSVTWDQHAMEVIFPVAPANGVEVRWGGYYAVPSRFAESTDRDMEATITGFLADECPFEVESIPLDDPVVMLPGGTPYGAEFWPNRGTDLARTPANGFVQQIEPTTAISFHLWDPADGTPAGGPFMFFAHTGAVGTIQVRDHLGGAVGSAIPAGQSYYLFLRVDAAGVRYWRLEP